MQEQRAISWMIRRGRCLGLASLSSQSLRYLYTVICFAGNLFVDIQQYPTLAVLYAFISAVGDQYFRHLNRCALIFTGEGKGKWGCALSVFGIRIGTSFYQSLQDFHETIQCSGMKCRQTFWTTAIHVCLLTNQEVYHIKIACNRRA